MTFQDVYNRAPKQSGVFRACSYCSNRSYYYIGEREETARTGQPTYPGTSIGTGRHAGNGWNIANSGRKTTDRTEQPVGTAWNAGTETGRRCNCGNGDRQPHFTETPAHFRRSPHLNSINSHSDPRPLVAALCPLA